MPSASVPTQETVFAGGRTPYGCWRRNRLVRLKQADQAVTEAEGGAEVEEAVGRGPACPKGSGQPRRGRPARKQNQLAGTSNGLLNRSFCKAKRPAGLRMRQSPLIPSPFGGKWGGRGRKPIPSVSWPQVA